MVAGALSGRVVRTKRGLAVDETSLDVIASTLEADPFASLGEVSSPDGAVTLLFGELVNVAEMRERLAPERLSSLLDDERMIATRIAQHHRGEVTRAYEDGFMIVFDSAHAGLRCAIELQRAFAAIAVEDAVGVPSLRLGLHTGTVIGGGEELYGRNVLLGARIAGTAGGREIVVSGKVREYTEGDASFEFTARGEHHFKGLHGEHELFSVTWQPGESPA